MRLWSVIPAAGASRRMGSSGAPKQYLTIAGRSVLEWSLQPFLARSDISGVVIVLAQSDEAWRELAVCSDARITTTIGGDERVHSVLSGLHALDDRADARDWVLVHDAARPCLSADDLQRLIDKLREDDVGGLLAVPLVDTLKRADSSDHVAATLARDLLWRALTPQMFRFGVLRQALARAIDDNVAVTDESQAIESVGLRPRLIAGDADNIKITTPADLERARRILEARVSPGT